MRRHSDPIVECPYDKSHSMPLPRLQWHLVKCNAKKIRDEMNLPTYHCKYNYLHIHFDEAKFAEHEEACRIEVERKKEVAAALLPERLSQTWDQKVAAGLEDGDIKQEGANTWTWGA